MSPADEPIVFAIEGPIARADLPGLCSRIRGLLEGTGATVALCNVGAGVGADAVTADALARLQLLAGRLGCRVLLHDVSDELLELLAFMGLRDVVPLRSEARRETEQREDGVRVEEERELDNPAV
jgi:ABC-type transporter Mla MlaB component